jgi:hypothetical protein
MVGSWLTAASWVVVTGPPVDASEEHDDPTASRPNRGGGGAASWSPSVATERLRLELLEQGRDVPAYVAYNRFGKLVAPVEPI